MKQYEKHLKYKEQHGIELSKAYKVKYEEWIQNLNREEQELKELEIKKLFLAENARASWKKGISLKQAEIREAKNLIWEKRENLRRDAIKMVRRWHKNQEFQNRKR